MFFKCKCIYILIICMFFFSEKFEACTVYIHVYSQFTSLLFVVVSHSTLLLLIKTSTVYL